MAVVRPDGGVKRLHLKHNALPGVRKTERSRVGAWKSARAAKEIIERAVFLNDDDDVLYFAAGKAPDWDRNERCAASGAAQARRERDQRRSANAYAESMRHATYHAITFRRPISKR